MVGPRFTDMPQHNMENSRQWQQTVPRPPWVSRLAEGHSPASSGAESDTESSSTESEKSCVRKLELGSPRLFPSPSKVQQRIAEIDQQREELKIELQLEIALLQGELQTEKSQIEKHSLKLQTLQQEARHRARHHSTNKLTERERLEQERSRVEELRRTCEEREALLPTQPESQREQLKVQLQQKREAMEAAVRAFEDWEFSVLERESGVEEEKEEEEEDEEKGVDEELGAESEASVEKEISGQQHLVNTAQERVQQLEKQLLDMEREKEKQLNALRKERRELVHNSHTVLKDKKPLADWSNITGSAPCMMSLSPVPAQKSPQDALRDSASLPRRRSGHRNSKLNDRPLSTQDFVRDGQIPEVYISPITSHRLSHGLTNGLSNGHNNGHSNGHRPGSSNGGGCTLPVTAPPAPELPARACWILLRSRRS
uniref:Pleckstrin homology-like domain family B member 3 n=1 Tax=Neogobius melanostomus TaxID=47308 RepID=A0A8C6UP60_9GOBI